MYLGDDMAAVRNVMESHNPVEVIKQVNALLAQENELREQFYNMVHEDMKAEFIAGEIVFHSPVRARHWLVSDNLVFEINTYVKPNKLGKVGTEKVMFTTGRHDFEPDIVFFSQQVANQFTPDQKLFPVPQLVVEILSESTEARDRGIKFTEYALAGVEEYWIVDADKNVLEQYILVGMRFQLVKAHLGAGLVQCQAIEGFKLDLSKVFTE